MKIPEDEMKYKKKKKKKVSKKSDHKHEYENIILKFPNEWFPGKYSLLLGSRCTICGKISYSSNLKSTIETTLNDRRIFKMLSNEELLEKYKELPIVFREKF